MWVSRRSGRYSVRRSLAPLRVVCDVPLCSLRTVWRASPRPPLVNAIGHGAQRQLRWRGMWPRNGALMRMARASAGARMGMLEHACVRICLCARVAWACTGVCVCVCARLCVRVYVFVCLCVCVSVCLCVCVSVCLCMCSYPCSMICAHKRAKDERLN